MPSPRELARAYDRYVVARRRDDREADAFAAWIASFWSAEAPPEPTDCPDAASVLGEAACAVRWYGSSTTVLGYAPGASHGCYQVPVAAGVPESRSPTGAATDDARAVGSPS